MPTTFIPLDYLHEMSHETSHISRYMGKKIKIVPKKVNAHFVKGQLISECLFEKIVWTKIPTKNLIDSAQQV